MLRKKATAGKGARRTKMAGVCIDKKHALLQRVRKAYCTVVPKAAENRMGTTSPYNRNQAENSLLYRLCLIARQVLYRLCLT